MPNEPTPTPELTENLPGVSTEVDLRALLGAISDVVLVLDGKGTYLWAAPTMVSKQPGAVERAAWLAGKTIHETRGNDAEADRLFAALRRAIDTGETQTVEYEVDMFGTPTWYSAAISKIDDDRVVWVARDITQTVNARQVLEQAVDDRTQEMSALLGISGALSSTLELDPLLNLILDQLKNLVPYSGAGVDLIVDGEVRQLAVRRPPGYPTTTAGSPPVRISDMPEPLQALLRNEPLHITDVLDDSPAAQTYRASWGGDLKGTTAEWVRSILLFPMFARDRLVGLINVASTRPAFFTDEHVGILRSIASQAATAIENARLFEETQRRARESRALLGTAKAIVSTLELEPLMDVVLDELSNVIPYDGAGVSLRKGDYFTQIAVRRPAGESTAVGHRFRIDSAEKLMARTLAGDTVAIPDIEGDTEDAKQFRNAWGGPLKGSAIRYARSWLGIPLISRGGVIGMLTIVKSEPGFFRDEHVAIGQVFAGHAAAAIENARLFEQVQQRARETQALLGVARGLSSTLELAPLLDFLLEELASVVPNHGASIHLREGDKLLRLAGRAETPAGVVPSGAPPAAYSIVELGEFWEEVETRNHLLIEDTHGGSELAVTYRRIWGGTLKGTPVEYQHSLLAVPLRLRDETVGMLVLGHADEGHFREEHIGLALAVGAQAAAAIENARLYEETRQRARETEALLEVSGAVVSTLELSALMRVILEKAGDIIERTGSAIVTLEGDDLMIWDATSEGGGDAQRGARIPLAISGAIWGPITRGEPVIIADIRADEPLAEAYRTAIGSVGLLERPPFDQLRSWMAVPLAAQGRVRGMLTMSMNEPDYFTAEHARLTGAFANQAALAIENARLFAETERRTKELAALLEVSRTVASTLDAQEVLGTILDQLGAITEHTGASILLTREDAFEMVEARSITGSRAEPGARIPFNVAPVLAEAIRNGETVIIDDVHADEPMAADYRASIAAMGVPDRPPFNVIRSWMAVPLSLQDSILGMLTISWTEPSYFTEDHARLARAFADQAVVAIENARLYEEARSSAREVAALLEADQKLFGSLDLDAVLMALVDVTVDILGADKGMVATQDATAQHLTLRASRNITPKGLALIEDMYARALPQGDQSTPVVTERPEDAHPLEAPVIEAEAIHSFIQVPILSATRGRLGFFVVAYTSEHKFSPDEQRLLAALADRAAVAIANAALYEKAQQAASLEERQKLARELHDSVSQALYGIALGARTARTLLDRDAAKAVEPVEYVLSLAEAGLTEMRALIFELRPESLEAEGLIVAVQKHAAALQARHGIQVACPECEEPKAPIAVKEAAYRIVQEALTNVLKHAHATEAAVSIDREPGGIRLTISDNGAGFDPGGDFPGHLGLKSMRERALKIGGDLVIESKPGAGTRVKARLPVPTPVAERVSGS